MSAKTASSFMREKLSKPTSFFGIPLWILIVASTAAFMAVILVLLCICFCYHRRYRKSYKSHFCLPKAIACKHCSSSLDKRLLSGNLSEIQMNFDKLSGHQLVPPERFPPQISGFIEEAHLTEKEFLRGSCFTIKEIEEATNGLALENVIGNGAYGIVYLGLLPDNKRVAVKRLVRDSCQNEDFALQMEAIGNVKHKNLVNLLGYCVEGSSRMSVFEYVDNRNLHHWLHEFPEQLSPLTWNIRLKIIRGMAKGLAYLAEDVEPKILHGCLNSTNVLLDRQWKPKISDFGFAKLFSPEWNHMINETLGYVSPECDSSSTSTERNDIYSFGILIMEIISGRTPVDHTQPQAYLIDWFKTMVANEKIGYIVDPKLPEMPPPKELKRIILVALRCVDPDVNAGLKMGDVNRMLDPRDLLLFDEHRIAMEACKRDHSPESQAAPGSADSALQRYRRLSSRKNNQKMEEN